MYLCFEGYNYRLIIFKVKIYDNFYIFCVKLFIRYDVLKYICDYFNV